ncbi:MAG: sigma-70 family RNA polymerase sigma factor, partial [Isosphaeraceae bacterium]
EAEAAFAALVRRHGPMVQRVCREVLKDDHDAQDAAQATFLALAIQARSIRRPGSLGPWLHGVALRVARHARADTRRRREIERRAARESVALEPAAETAEIARLLHEQVDRLPGRYRSVIVACDLEGLPHAEAARRLQLPVRTLQTRLYRGRERLRARLVCGGFTLAGAGLADLLGETSRAAVSVAWTDATAQAAARIAEGSLALSAGLVSSRVLGWAKGLAYGRAVLRAAVVAIALSTSGLIVGGSLVLANRDGGEPQKAPDEAQPPANTPAIPPPPARKPQAGSPIARPLPDPVELQRILREVAQEGMRLAKEKPLPGSSMLAKIAEIQAKVGDRAGATETFDAAIRAAGGDEATPPNANRLSWIGQTQASVGMTEAARATLSKAARAIPIEAGDLDRWPSTLTTMCLIIKTQNRVGDRYHAKENLKLLERLEADVLQKSKPIFEGLDLSELAGAQASAADFDGAFATVERLRKGDRNAAYKVGDALGKIAEGVEFLKPLEIRRFVRRLAEEVDQLKDASQRYPALLGLAQAQAWLGDIQAARKSALAIGKGSGWTAIYTAYDERPYALLRVAGVQIGAGDLAGARETLRLGYETVKKVPSVRLLDLGGGQIAAGDLDGALVSAKGMKPSERSEALARIARAQAIRSSPEQAQKTIRQALEDFGLNPENGAVIHPRITSAENSKIALLQGMAGEVETALATASAIKDPGYRQMGFANVVMSRAQAGDPAEALRLARGLKSVDDRREALFGLACGLSDRLELEQYWKQAKAPPHGR